MLIPLDPVNLLAARGGVQDDDATRELRSRSRTIATCYSEVIRGAHPPGQQVIGVDEILLLPPTVG
jgi:hypothetical protein